MNTERIEIRTARLTDAAEMARLASELGHAMSSADMARRLTTLLPTELHYVAVAAIDEDLFGWIHVERRFSLEGGERAELMGLVVDSSARRSGVGRKLVGAAENWTLTQGLVQIAVRSNVIREQSHPFYESLGYVRKKTQHVYTKALVVASSDKRDR